MFCAECGANLPDDAKFCPRCGKPSIHNPCVPNSNESIAPSPSAPSAEVSRSIVQPEQDSASGEKDPTAPTKLEEQVPPRRINHGSVILGIAALICLVLGALQGFIPIFIIEGVAFTSLAWFCAAKWPLSSRSNAMVFVAALLLAGLTGVTLDQDTFGPRYRYLSQGSAQFRIDEKAGRTDRLGSGGWSPVAYDREAQVLDTNLNESLGLLYKFTLTNGFWEPPMAGGRVCFSVDNNSEYVIKKIDIKVSITNTSDATTAQKDADPFAKYAVGTAGPVVKLQDEAGGLITPGANRRMCGTAPRALEQSETWSYIPQHYYGWKR